MNTDSMSYRTGVLALAMLCACSEATIQQGLEERAANEVVAELAARGFEAAAQPDGGRKQTWSVHVPSADRTAAIQVLVRLGLPRQKQPSSAELLKPGLVPTPAEERTLHSLALQGDLARTLEQMDGVLSARVHLSVPVPSKAGQGGPGESRCAVLLRVKGPPAKWTERKRVDVRTLVAGSVEGLAIDHVTLVLDEVSSLAPAEPRPTQGEGRRRWVLTALALFALAAVGWSCWGSLSGWFRHLWARIPARTKPTVGGPARP